MRPWRAGWARPWGLSCPSWHRGCQMFRRRDLDVSDLLLQPAARRRSGELAEVPIEVRLVGVAGRRGDVGAPPAGPRDQPPGAVEPDDARGGLGREPDLAAKHGSEVAGAPACLEG